jgi:hypothetical protein
MRNALHLSETSTATTKSNKTVDLASLGRQPVVPMKCLAPVSPYSVRPVSESLAVGSDELLVHNIQAALKHGALETHGDD